MKIELIRHATIILYFGDKRLLVDPVFGSKGTISAIKNVPNTNDNPLVELPVPISTLAGCDAVLVTHTHRDHFDDRAMEVLPKNINVFCQPEDEEKIRSKGYTNVTSVKNHSVWGNIKINRTGGRHGHGIIAAKMAPVSGFVIEVSNEPTVYVLGDTVWCRCVKQAMDEYKPDIAVCNCGEAKFSTGRAITMGENDIGKLCSEYPETKVVAVHMEAWNHCRLSRQALQDFVKSRHLDGRVAIPADGEMLSF